MTTTFNTHAFAAACGVTYRIADHWARNGVLRPSVADANGSGTARQYSEHDLRVGKVIARLNACGASHAVLAEVTALLTERDWPGSWNGYLVVTPDGLITWATAPVEVFDAGGVSAAWVVRLASIDEQVHAAA